MELVSSEFLVNSESEEKRLLSDGNGTSEDEDAPGEIASFAKYGRDRSVPLLEVSDDVRSSAEFSGMFGTPFPNETWGPQTVD
jgi:hypothetical protein